MLPKTQIRTNSKTATAAREMERVALGIGKDYKMQTHNPEFQSGMANDPAYYREILGDTSSLNWDEI